MTQWVDAKCYVVVDASSGQSQRIYYTLEEALDAVESNPGLTVIVQDCIRSHTYHQEAEGFNRCTAVFVPKDSSGSMWMHRCYREAGHPGSHEPQPYMGPGQWVVPSGQ